MDGLCGTVFAMTTAIKALVDTLPPERKARPTLAILGGGGYIGARLVTVLASKQQASAAGTDKDTDHKGKDHTLDSLPSGAVLLDQTPHNSDDDLSDDTTASHDQDLATATVMLREDPWSRFAYKQVIAMDLRYEGNRHEEAGVLYTADPRDLSAADVVLVITRNGDNVAGYVEYARPGQVRTQTLCCKTGFRDALVLGGLQYLWSQVWAAAVHLACEEPTLTHPPTHPFMHPSFHPPTHPPRRSGATTPTQRSATSSCGSWQPRGLTFTRSWLCAAPQQPSAHPSRAGLPTAPLAAC